MMSRTRIQLLQEISDLSWKNRELQKEIDLLKKEKDADFASQKKGVLSSEFVPDDPQPSKVDIRTMRDTPPIPKPKKVTEEQIDYDRDGNKFVDDTDLDD